MSLEMSTLAMGLGTDESYGEGASRFWIVTYGVSEPGRYRTQVSCPF